jgi:hypothetical protein
MVKFNVFVGNVPVRLAGLEFSWLSTRIDNTAGSVILLVNHLFVEGPRADI